MSPRTPTRSAEATARLRPAQGSAGARAAAFAWARTVGATQPPTSGLYGDWPEPLSGVFEIQVQESDIISCHSYDKPAVFEKKLLSVARLNRSMICTEYMARSVGSTFQNTLPIAWKYRGGAINWGSSRARHRRTILGTPGRGPTPTNPRRGFTTCSVPMVGLTIPRRRIGEMTREARSEFR
jgi:hypothetical protein